MDIFASWMTLPGRATYELLSGVDHDLAAILAQTVMALWLITLGSGMVGSWNDSGGCSRYAPDREVPMWDESPYHALLLALVAFNTVMSILTFLELPHRRRDWRKPP